MGWDRGQKATSHPGPNEILPKKKRGKNMTEANRDGLETSRSKSTKNALAIGEKEEKTPCEKT